jgi:hypothetical protein
VQSAPRVTDRATSARVRRQPVLPLHRGQDRDGLVGTAR